MNRFTDRVSNGKRKLEVYDNDGNVTEQIVKLSYDPNIDNMTVAGIPLNAATFNALIDEIENSVTLGSGTSPAKVKLNLTLNGTTLDLTTSAR